MRATWGIGVSYTPPTLPSSCYVQTGIDFSRTVRKMRPTPRLPWRSGYLFSRSRFKTWGLFSSRKASEATHFAVPESILCILIAVDTAALLSLRLRFPICLSAQLTAFLTKFLSSDAPAIMSGRKSMNSLSFARLSWTASSAINTKPALFTNSSSRLHHSLAFATANGVLSNRVPQEPSTISHESKSRTGPFLRQLSDRPSTSADRLLVWHPRSRLLSPGRGGSDPLVQENQPESRPRLVFRSDSFRIAHRPQPIDCLFGIQDLAYCRPGESGLILLYKKTSQNRDLALFSCWKPLSTRSASIERRG